MNAIFVPIRTLHILLAALWIGSSAAIGLFVMSALAKLGTGPEVGKFLTNFLRSGFIPFIASTGGLTIVSGLYLYWHFTAGFDPTISRSAGGMTFGAGAVLGIVAGILGGRLGRGMKQLAATATSLATADAASRARLEADFVRGRDSAATLGHVLLGLLVVTLILMSLGHYV